MDQTWRIKIKMNELVMAGMCFAPYATNAPYLDSK